MDIWWIDEPRILGSANPSETWLDRLRLQGFNMIVSLLQENVQQPGYDVARATQSGYIRHCIPVQDFKAPTIAQLQEFIELVRATPASSKIVVHCQGGSGRTGTFAAAYWIEEGLSVSDAIAKVRNVREGAIEGVAQETVLTQFETNKRP